MTHSHMASGRVSINVGTTRTYRDPKTPNARSWSPKGPASATSGASSTARMKKYTTRRARTWRRTSAYAAGTASSIDTAVAIRLTSAEVMAACRMESLPSTSLNTDHWTSVGSNDCVVTVSAEVASVNVQSSGRSVKMASISIPRMAHIDTLRRESAISTPITLVTISTMATANQSQRSRPGTRRMP